MLTKILIATSNAGKIKEIQAYLAPLSCVSKGELGIGDPEETGLSFIENALIKARHASQFSGMPALGDDSGLVVPALQGQPGIYSSRFAGVHATDDSNNALLLEKMAKIPDNQRQAYFYCALTLVLHADDPTPIIATGRLSGKILHTPQGSQGFGYDPLFYVETHQCSLAELSLAEKNKISHRALALTSLRTALDQLS